ncbi:hypothetical protein AABB24_010635, partial [Solanum stoloniferum]
LLPTSKVPHPFLSSPASTANRPLSPLHSFRYNNINNSSRRGGQPPIGKNSSEQQPLDADMSPPGEIDGAAGSTGEQQQPATTARYRRGTPAASSSSEIFSVSNNSGQQLNESSTNKFRIKVLVRQRIPGKR